LRILLGNYDLKQAAVINTWQKLSEVRTAVITGKNKWSDELDVVRILKIIGGSFGG
jgi:hypothetical protein